MDTRNVIFLILMFCVPGFGSSDLEQDRAECSTQLMGLATCLPYVGGDAKAPTKDCCDGFKQVLDKSDKCICILIKDRNDPKLGLNINVTLALNLPKLCQQPTPNISQCVSILHLTPNSPDAKEFETLGKVLGNATASPPKQKSTPAAASEKSDGGKRERWLGVDMIIYGVLVICSFTS